MQVSDDLYLGPAVAGGSAGVSAGPSPMDVGVGPLGRVYVWDVVPLTLQTTGLAAAQTNAATAGSLTLAAGTGVTTSVDATGTTQYVLDVPRIVTLTVATTNDSGLTFVITGKDVYGQTMTQSIAGPNNNTVSTTKCFKSVSSITYSGGAIATNGVSAGYGDTIGCPIAIRAKEYVAQANYNATAVALSAVTAAVATSPATATTGDVRGSVALPSAADGTKRLVMTLAVPAIACGPTATRVGAYGVTQV